MKARERAGQIVALAASIILMLMAAAYRGHRHRRLRIEAERNELLLGLVASVDRQTEQVERVAETFGELAKMD